MSQLLAIKERIRTITNLRKVTRAMELVTRTKINRARNNATATRRFQLLFEDLFRLAIDSAEEQWRIRRAPGDAEAETARHPAGPRRFVVAVLSQKGFCGSFNDRVLSTLHRQIVELQQQPSAQVNLTIIGRRNSKWSYVLRHEFEHIAAPEREYATHIAPLADRLSREVMVEGDVEIYFVFNQLISILEQRPIVLRVYPPEESDELDPQKAVASGQVLFEPAPELLMPALVPAYLRACLERAYWETIAGENCARLLSMKNANDNASKMLDALKIDYNKTRQTRITQELSEIVSAFDVLRSIQQRQRREED
ncbi:MAG TPA: FoF1 ATP synthase subunit gamma [Spirochaetia bacterium]|nr:FoF1 ATP synthase subunit gamma [Spirochaetia bacterium]